MADSDVSDMEEGSGSEYLPGEDSESSDSDDDMDDDSDDETLSV